MKFGLITDFHAGQEQYFGIGNWRDCPTYETRIDASMAQFEADGVDVVVTVGDAIDSNEGSPWTVAKGNFATAIAAFESGSFDVYHTIGNHEWIAFAGDMEAFWAAVDGGSNSGARENPYPDATNTLAYTYEVGGIRFVVVLNGGFDTNLPAQKTWLENVALNTSLPVIILTHWIRLPSSDPGDFIPAYEAAGNVQWSISGHNHLGQITQVFNDIPYTIFNGSVASNSDFDPMNAFFTIEIIPFAVYTPNGQKANIEITGYGVNGQTATKLFNSYVVV